MSENRIVIFSDRLMRKVDEYRGQLSRADFVSKCIEKILCGLELEPKTGINIIKKKDTETGITPASTEHVTKDDFELFKQNIEKLQQEFMDVFIKYGKQLAGETLSKEEAKRFNEELNKLLQL